jgi:hypothetical protein
LLDCDTGLEVETTAASSEEAISSAPSPSAIVAVSMGEKLPLKRGTSEEKLSN